MKTFTNMVEESGQFDKRIYSKWLYEFNKLSRDLNQLDENVPDAELRKLTQRIKDICCIYACLERRNNKKAMYCEVNAPERKKGDRCVANVSEGRRYSLDQMFIKCQSRNDTNMKKLTETFKN